MQFAVGSAVYLSSLIMLAIFTRIAATDPDPAILRGEFAAGLISVMITSGLTLGLLMMVFGGSGYFASVALEAVVILGFAIVSSWLIVKLFGRKQVTATS